MAEEVDDLAGPDGAGIEAEVEAPPRDAGDHRELAPGEVELQLGRFAAGRPRAGDGGPLAQSAFIDKDDGSLVFSGLFFSAGQVWRFQRAMASSSRSTARPVGRWQLQPMRESNFHTCAG